MNNAIEQAPNAEPLYDYSNNGRPRDFDIRIEVAEQPEILKQNPPRSAAYRWHCSDYDF